VIIISAFISPLKWKINSIFYHNVMLNQEFCLNNSIWVVFLFYFLQLIERTNEASELARTYIRRARETTRTGMDILSTLHECASQYSDYVE
jgi:hypothetical protein